MAKRKPYGRTPRDGSDQSERRRPNSDNRNPSGHNRSSDFKRGDKPARPSSDDRKPPFNRTDGPPRRSDDTRGKRLGGDPKFERGSDGSRGSYNTRDTRNENSGGRKPFVRRDSNSDNRGSSNRGDGDNRRPYKPRDERPSDNKFSRPPSRFNDRPERSNDRGDDQRPPRRNDGDDRDRNFPEKKSFDKRVGGEPDRRSSHFEKREQDRSRGYQQRKSYGDENRQPSREDNDRPKRNNYTNQDNQFKPSSEKSFPKPFGDKPSFNDDSKQRKRLPYRSKINEDQNPKERLAPKTGDDGTLRLNKYIANAGICSRREADQHIAAGEVTVNGEVITEMGHRVKPEDRITYRGKKVQYGNKVYILMNKPKDFITTTADEHDRKTVMEIIGDAVEEFVYPVGRLDRNTTGLLLLTNDGELAQKLMHPSYRVRKVYQVTLDKPVAKEDMEKISEGVELDDGKALVDEVAYADPKDKRVIGIDLHIGKNRIVRRIFEKLGYDVLNLDRVLYADLTKKDLPRGKWRFLKEKEISLLYQNMKRAPKKLPK